MSGIDKTSIRKAVFEKFNGHCAYCGCALNDSNFSIDHIEPKFRGYSNEELARYNRVKGKDNIENLNPCCRSCNSSKSTYTVEKWRQEIFLKFERSVKESSNLRLIMRLGMIKYKHDFKFYFEKHGL